MSTQLGPGAIQRFGPQGGGMWWVVILGYLAVGCCCLFSARGQRAIREEIRSTNFAGVPAWKASTFRGVLSIGLVLLWPSLVKQWFPVMPLLRRLVPEWVTAEGRAVRAARAFAKTHKRIEPRPNHVQFSREDSCWYVSFDIVSDNPEIVSNPTFGFDVRVDAVTLVACRWERDYSGWK